MLKEMKLDDGSVIEVLDLTVMGEEKRRAGKVVFDRMKIEESKKMNKKITLVSTAEKEESVISVSYHSSEFGTLYPDKDYTAPKFQADHFRIIDRARALYVKYGLGSKSEMESENAHGGSDDAEPEVEEISYDAMKEKLMEIDGIGEKTADKVIEVSRGEGTLDDVPYLPDDAEPEIRAAFDGVVLV